MTALQISFNQKIGSGDLSPPFQAQLHRAEQPLETVIYTVLFTNARVTTDSQLPPGEYDRGGHWADMFYGDSFGSLLWTLKRKTNISDTWRTAKRYAQNALERWVDSSIARAFTVTTGYAGLNRMYIDVVAKLPNGSDSHYRFEVELNGA